MVVDLKLNTRHSHEQAESRNTVYYIVEVLTYIHIGVESVHDRREQK